MSTASAALVDKPVARPVSLARRITGWVLIGLIAALMLGPSAMSKFLDWEGKEAQFQKAGFTVDQMFQIGIVEVICAVLLLIPQTAFVGAILVTGYLGGAICTHLRVGEPVFMPIILGVIVWVALGLRRPGIFRMAFGAKTG